MPTPSLHIVPADPAALEAIPATAESAADLRAALADAIEARRAADAKAAAAAKIAARAEEAKIEASLEVEQLRRSIDAAGRDATRAQAERLTQAFARLPRRR